MADSKITALTSIGASTDPANDPLVLVDVSDTSMAATGTTKKVTLNQLLGASGTATLASATITGDLTVDTSTLKVDSANNRVGIGTATPSVALDVVGASALSGTVSVGTTTPLATGSGRGNVTINGSTDAILAFGIGGVNSGFVLQDSAGMTLLSSGATYLRCYTNNSERYRIASDGVATWSNVGGVAGTAMTLNSTGLGVGASPITKLQISGGSSAVYQTFTNTSGAYQHAYVGNPSSALTFGFSSQNGSFSADEKMRIDSSGNVGVGVTPSAWGSGGNIELNGSTGNIAFRLVSTLACNWYYNSGDKFIGTGYAQQYQQYQGVHKWFTSTLSGSAGGSATMSQLMTLDASGNLLVGKTAVGTTVGIEVRPDGYLIATRSASTDGAAFTNAVYSTGASAYRFYVGMGGTVFATNTTISAISDARLKENVQDIDVGLGAILALKPRKFDWKEGKGKNIKGDRGFIAQEFEAVFPQLVDEWRDPAPEGEASYKSVRQDLIPVLVKAIQELTARVEALEA